MANKLPMPKVREQQFVAGGDIRLQDNQWLIAAMKDAQLSRCPREAMMRNIVGYLVHEYKLCLLPSTGLDPPPTLY